MSKSEFETIVVMHQNKNREVQVLSEVNLLFLNFRKINRFKKKLRN